jgi:hypothetical protein
VSGTVSGLARARWVAGSQKQSLLAYWCLMAFHLSLAACSETVTIERLGEVEVQVDAPGGAKLRALEDQPLTINLNVPGDSDAWVRGRYFFQHYTSGESIILDRELASDPLTSDPYKCHIFRRPNRQGAEYTVTCNGSNVGQSRVAAQNISRFLESGVLSDSGQFSFR